MRKLIAAAAFAAIAFSSTYASAAWLTSTGGDAYNLIDFDLTPSTGLVNGDEIQRYTEGGTAGSLALNGAPTDVTFEYLGSEASHVNFFVDISSGHDVMFQNKDTLTGFFLDNFTPATALYATDSSMINSDGPLGFEFESAKACFWIFCSTTESENGGDIDGGQSIGLYRESAQSFIVLFGDGTGDSDMDDMAVRISVVPVPAALPLFGAALIGMGFLARRRKQKAALQA